MKFYFIMNITQKNKIDYLRIEIHLKTYKKMKLKKPLLYYRKV